MDRGEVEEMIWMAYAVTVTVFCLILLGIYLLEKRDTKNLLEIKKNLKELSELNQIRKRLRAGNRILLEVRLKDEDDLFLREPE